MFPSPNMRPIPMREDCEGEEATFTCRICFEEDCKPSELISPCRCKGTLKYVHQSCLHKWQSNVQKLGGKRDERATICGVCRTKYTSLPPKAAMHVWCKIWSCTRGLLGAICISLLALCLSGPPLLHLMLLLMLLVSSRSQSVLVLLLMMLGGVMASLYARGLRLVLRSEGDMRLGLALIRHGAPVEGLGAGSLLVAHHSSLDGTFFAQSVVLLTEKNSRGAKGVVLTQPMETIDSQLWDHQLAERLSHSSPIRHFLGGPVGLPSHSGPASQTVVLHHIPYIHGAVAVLQSPAAAAEALGLIQQQQQRQIRGGTRVVEQHGQQRQQQRGWCPDWLGFCQVPGPAVQQLRQQGRLAAVAAADVHTAVTSSTNRNRPVSSNGGSGNSGSSSLDALGLYQGGSLDELLQEILLYNTNTAAAAAAAAAPAGGSNSRTSSLAARLRGWNRNTAAAAANLSSSSRSSRQQQQHKPTAHDLAVLRAAVRMYHGVCSWSAGQLEGEIRAGAWGVIDQAAVADVVETPPQLLWQQLVHGHRPRWF